MITHHEVQLSAIIESVERCRLMIVCNRYHKRRTSHMRVRQTPYIPHAVTTNQTTYNLEAKATRTVPITKLEQHERWPLPSWGNTNAAHYKVGATRTVPTTKSGQHEHCPLQSWGNTNGSHYQAGATRTLPYFNFQRRSLCGFGITNTVAHHVRGTTNNVALRGSGPQTLDHAMSSTTKVSIFQVHTGHAGTLNLINSRGFSTCYKL